MNKIFFILIIILYLYLLIYLNKKIKEADNIVNIYFEKLEIILRKRSYKYKKVPCSNKWWKKNLSRGFGHYQ